MQTDELLRLGRQKAVHFGAEGQQWLDSLPDTLADLQRRWSIRIGRPLDSGFGSLVMRVRTDDSQDAVLKVALPDPWFARQVETIADAAGRGYVNLLGYDLGRNAMLQEALGPSIAHLDLAPEAALELLSETLVDAWQVPRRAGLTVKPEEEKASSLAGLVSELWEKLGRPCPQSVVDKALSFAANRAAAFDLDRCVVVHGDPHPGNALTIPAGREPGSSSGYVFVDPDGFLAAPAYDLGVALRDWCPQVLDAGAGAALGLVQGYCKRLAATSGIDETAIWEWGFLERVSTGLYLLNYGADGGHRYLDAAALLT